MQRGAWNSVAHIGLTLLSTALRVSEVSFQGGRLATAEMGERSRAEGLHDKCPDTQTSTGTAKTVGHCERRKADFAKREYTCSRSQQAGSRAFWTARLTVANASERECERVRLPT